MEPDVPLHLASVGEGWGTWLGEQTSLITTALIMGPVVPPIESSSSSSSGWPWQATHLISGDSLISFASRNERPKFRFLCQ